MDTAPGSDDDDFSTPSREGEPEPISAPAPEPAGPELVAQAVADVAPFIGPAEAEMIRRDAPRVVGMMDSKARVLGRDRKAPELWGILALAIYLAAKHAKKSASGYVVKPALEMVEFGIGENALKAKAEVEKRTQDRAADAARQRAAAVPAAAEAEPEPPPSAEVIDQWRRFAKNPGAMGKTYRRMLEEHGIPLDPGPGPPPAVESLAPD